MATRNPFGTVALGQEGSGLAQVLTPYDSAKYDNAIIEQEQTKRKEEAKALQELKKDYKLGDMVDLDKYWEKDIDTYSDQFKELYNEEVSLFTDAINVRQINDYNTFLNESDKLTRRWAEHNKKAKLYNEDVYLSTKNKEVFNEAKKFAESNVKAIDVQLWEKRKKEFTNPPDYVMKEAGGDLQKARVKYLQDYCDDELVPQRFVHEDFQKDIRALTAQTAEKKSGGGVTWVDNYQNSGIGGFVKSDGQRVMFSDDEEKAIVLANISNNKRALDFYRTLPQLKAPLETYAKDKGKSIEELSYPDMYDFMATDPDAMNFMKSQYFWKDEVKSSQSFSQARDGGGSGAEIQTSINDGSKVMRNEGSVDYQASKLLGAKYIKPQMFAQVAVTTNVGGKYINKHSSTWTPSTNTKTALKGSTPPQTPVTLKSATIEANTITIAKDDITYNDGTGTITINKGSSVDVNLLKNKNFVAANHGKLDYKIYGTAIFTDDAYKLDHPLYAPIEDMKTLFTPDGYSEVQKRNKIEYKQDGSVIYFSEDNEEQGSGTFDATNY